jgi:hypothetical protein
MRVSTSAESPSLPFKFLWTLRSLNARALSFICGICVVAVLLWPIRLSAQTAAPKTHMGERIASEFPGASIVEQMQGAIRDCASGPCEVYIPAGTYNSSPISTWKARDVTGASVGVAIPSNVDIRGAGRGHTIINVTRAPADPVATLFANAARSNQNIRLRDMTIHWTDSAQTYDWVSIFICHGCENLELDHLELEGNPNKLVNLLDSSASNVHDNIFALRSTGYGHGDSALSVSSFDPAAKVSREAGVVRDNHFTQTGDSRLFSMLIVAQSGLYVHANVFETHLPPPPGNATAIESGTDNMGRLPDNVKISGNVFHSASIAYGGLNNSEISDNFLDHGDIYIALQGPAPSLSGLTIAGNELHFGSIGINGVEHTFTGRILVTRNRIFDGNIGTGNSSLVRDIEVSYNHVRYSANKNGIDCNACSVIKGNVVRDIGQGLGNLTAGFLIGGAVNDVSDNIYIDEQHDYDAGTICSVATSSSAKCLSSGASRWISLHGGEWGLDWSNRTLFTARGNFLIRAFAGPSLLELDEDAPALPAETHYHLYRTTFNAFELNGAVIERFSNNSVISAGGFRHAAIQEDGQVRVRSLSGNVFHPYSCVGKCAIDYRSTVSQPE